MPTLVFFTLIYPKGDCLVHSRCISYLFRNSRSKRFVKADKSRSFFFKLLPVALPVDAIVSFIISLMVCLQNYVDKTSTCNYGSVLHCYRRQCGYTIFDSSPINP